MSVLLGVPPVSEIEREDLRSLLDELVPCEYPGTDEHRAHVAIRCRRCSAVQLLCRPHLEQLRTMSSNMPRRSKVLVCAGCSAYGEDFDTVAEVVPL